MDVYIYIYIYTHTHTQAPPEAALAVAGARLGVSLDTHGAQVAARTRLECLRYHA